MVQPIAFTPPLLSSRPMPIVRRRILFYLPGYDPDAKRRYRTLFMRELRRYTKRFGIAQPRVSRAKLSDDGQVQTWTVKAGDAVKGTETVYEVLLWDDLVQQDMARPHLTSALLNAAALLHVIANGTFFRLYRASWKCGTLILYPFVMSLLLPGTVLAGSAQPRLPKHRLRTSSLVCVGARNGCWHRGTSPDRASARAGLSVATDE